jgi:hypothetical protein
MKMVINDIWLTISSGITDENESVKATLITILHEAYKLNQILLQIQTVILSRQNLVS